jgi:hypothetical protein
MKRKTATTTKAVKAAGTSEAVEAMPAVTLFSVSAVLMRMNFGLLQMI